MSTPVYEAFSYAMRYWFIAVALGILVAMIVASYREYREKQTIKSELSQFLGYLEIIDGPESFIGDRFGIREMNRIGSADDGDIVLPDVTVQPTHAFMYMEGDKLMLEPHTRLGATTINGRVAIRRHVLKTGDVVGIGDVQFAVYIRRTRLTYDH